MASRKNVTTARRLRREMTDAERRMWRMLRSQQLAGFKFRRQESIGGYIVDFVCFSRRLVIEVDGGQHASEVEYDGIRTRLLASRGFYVPRLWNNEVLENPEGVFLRIVEILRMGPPHPPGAPRRAPPSPARGEGV